MTARKRKTKSPPPSSTASDTAAPQLPLTRQPRFVGVDLHKKIAVFHILAADGTSIDNGRFAVTPEAIRDFAAEYLEPTDELAVEATSNTWAFTGLVTPFVAKVVVSNPLKTKAIAEANVKTDKVDARVIADLLRCNFLPSVWQPSPATAHNRSLAGRRTALVQQRTAIRNRIHAILAQRLISAPAGGLFSGKGLNWLKTVDLDQLGRSFIDSDLRLLEAIEKESNLIDHMIIEESYDDSDVQILMTLPGFDYTVAHALKATLGDVNRFANPDKAANYLGLVPRVKQSANNCYYGPITKAGASETRWLLIQAAQHVASHPGPLGAFFRKLARKKHRNIAVVATARKLVTIAVHMLKNKEPYRYASPRATEAKLANLRVAATAEKKKSGPRPGSAAPLKLGPGRGRTRTIKSLDEVYQKEQLPPRRELSSGERRIIEESGTSKFVESLAQKRVVSQQPRKRGEPASSIT